MVASRRTCTVFPAKISAEIETLSPEGIDKILQEELNNIVDMVTETLDYWNKHITVEIFNDGNLKNWFAKGKSSTQFIAGLDVKGRDDLDRARPA